MGLGTEKTFWLLVKPLLIPSLLFEHCCPATLPRYTGCTLPGTTSVLQCICTHIPIK